MLKRALAVIFLASIAGLALLTFLAASTISSPDPGLSRSNQTINRVTKPDPQLPELPGEGRVEIRGYEASHPPVAPLGSALGGSANTQAGPDTFYGNETLYPLIDSGTMIIPLPGGARVEIRDGETTYVLTDHLGSARVALGADNTVSGRIEYTPFGERRETGDADVVRSYTGKVFEPETGTYDFHARRYNPSSGRFTSVDAARKSISPYSYASNNPVNTVDPDGLGPVYFFLYSGYGVIVNDRSGRPRLLESALHQRELAGTSGLRMIMGELESTDTVALSTFDKMQHLSLTLHGTAETVFVLDPKTGNRVAKNGEEFAEFLYDRLQAAFGEASGDLKSITFHGCELACRTGQSLDGSIQSEISFADRFAGAAKNLFPNLEHVFASPYAIGIRKHDEDPSSFSLEVHNEKLDHALTIQLTASDYFRGDLPPELLQPPSVGTVENVWSVSHQTGTPGETLGEAVTSAEEGNRVISERGFTDPVFREIPVPPLVEPLTD